MESLRHLFKNKAAFVSSSEHDGNPPSEEQLASFLRTLTAETGLALRGAPPGVTNNPPNFYFIIFRVLRVFLLTMFFCYSGSSWDLLFVS